MNVLAQALYELFAATDGQYLHMAGRINLSKGPMGIKDGRFDINIVCGGYYTSPTDRCLALVVLI